MALLKRFIDMGSRHFWKHHCSSSLKCDFSVESLPGRSCVRFYSTRVKSVPLVDKEIHSLFVVQKRNFVGFFYKNLSDVQSHVGSLDPNSCDGKECTEMKSQDKVRADEKNIRSRMTSSKWIDYVNRILTSLEKRPSSSISVASLKKLAKPKPKPELKKTCLIEFSGSSIRNPSLAGAGAVLRTEDGRLICKLRQGLGIATCKAAEYGGLILGLKYAIEKGYKRIGAVGDSMLVCNQLTGQWNVKNKELLQLHKEAKELISNKCITFKIGHRSTQYINDAHTQAKLATRLYEGQVKRVRGIKETEIRLKQVSRRRKGKK